MHRMNNPAVREDYRRKLPHLRKPCYKKLPTLPCQTGVVFEALGAAEFMALLQGKDHLRD
jgi:hypothetical protein